MRAGRTALLVFAICLVPATAAGWEVPQFPLIGHWEVVDLYGYCAVSVDPAPVLAEWVGQVVCYGMQSMESGGETMEDPEYTVRWASSEDLWMAFRLRLPDLSIAAPGMLRVSVRSETQHNARQFGLEVLLLDDDEILVVRDGIVLRLRKLPD